MKPRRLALSVAVLLAMSGCGDDSSAESTDAIQTTVAPTPETGDATTATSSAGTQQGMGPDSDLSRRHRAPIPAEYAGLTNPVAADEASLARGAEAYAVCAACHGETGLGDGTAGAALDPAPVNIAHTSQMMGDDYFFWRITDGGAEFETLMPAWGTALDEQTRWDLINYIQALGEGTASPGRGMGRAGANPEARAVEQEALLAVAVQQGLITQEDADIFNAAHETVDSRMAEARAANPDETVDALLGEVLDELVAAGELTQDEADTFLTVRDTLSGAGLLP